MENKNWNKKDLEERLPDYIFGKLNEDETRIFELEIVNYPDLIQEIELGKKVFNRIEHIDFDSILDQKTKNISYNVNNRINDKYSSKILFNFSWRLVMPVLGLIAIAFILYYTGDNQVNGNSSSFAININTEEIDKIIGDTDSNEVMINIYAEAGNNNLFDNTSINEIEGSVIDEEGINTLIADTYIESIYDKETNLLNDNHLTDSDILETLNQIDETEFENILKEIKNADIII